MKKLMIVMVVVSFLFGCQGTKEITRPDLEVFFHPDDDGQQCVPEEGIVKKANKAERAMRRGITCVDFGSSDKLLIVRVEDEMGQPLLNATMYVRFYFGRSLRGEWMNLPASSEGEISFFAPGYFGPMRIEIYIIRASGYEPRMLKKFGVGKDDSLFYIEEALRKELLEGRLEWLKHLKRPVFSGPLSGHFNNELKKFYFYTCGRRIVLRKKEILNQGLSPRNKG